MQRPLPRRQQTGNLRGGQPSPADLQQHGHQAPHHPPQKGVGRDPDLHAGSAPRHRHLGQAAHGPTPRVGPQCRKVPLAEELRRCGAHRPHVEQVTDLERPMPIHWPSIACHPNPVAIDAPLGLAPGVEPDRRRLERTHHQVGWENGIQPSPQLGPSDPLAARAASEAEGRDLAGGVHPGIGSPGETDSHPLAGQSVKRLLQHPLHRPKIRLVLGAGEVSPVVLDHRPCASLRHGGDRVRFRYSPDRARLAQTSSICTIGAASPRRCPIFMMRV